tara:strand:- start:558 stop:1835 length:1278 start_codon:yes stop_codon:yes gene_type:complete
MSFKLEVKLKLDIYFGLYIPHAEYEEMHVPRPHGVIERFDNGTFIQIKYTEKTNETDSGRMYKKYITDNMAIVKWYEDSAGVRKRLDRSRNNLAEAGISIKNLNIDMAGNDPRDGIIMSFNIYHDGSLSINELRDDLSSIIGMMVNPQPAGDLGVIHLDRDGLEEQNAVIEAVINEEESIFRDATLEGGALYGHMGVNTPNSNKILKKLYQNTPTNRKLKRVGKPYGYIHTSNKTGSPKKSTITLNQKKTAVKGMPQLRKDLKKCSVGYSKGSKMKSPELVKLYKDCRKYSPKLIKKKKITRTDLIGKKTSPNSGALKQYSSVIRKKLLQANKIIIDYQQQSKSSDEVVVEKVVSNSQRLRTRRKLAEKRGEIIMVETPDKKGRKSPKRKSPRRKSPRRKSPRSKSPKRKSPKRKSPRSKSPKRK